MEVIATSGRNTLYREASENEVKICSKYLPLQGYGNNVKTCIHVYRQNETYHVEIYQVRENWNGTGRDDLYHARITEDEFNKLVELIRNIKTLDDFKNLEKYVIARINEIDNEITKTFDNIINLFSEYIVSRNKLEIIRNQEKLRKLAEEFIEEYLEEYSYF